MPTAIGDRKVCSKCKTDLHVSAFGKKSARPDGLQSQCRGCMGNMPSRTPQARQAYRATPRWKGMHRGHKLRSMYGLAPCDLTRMRIEQGDVCAICGGRDEHKNLAVDHCHETGKVRGLLCYGCNVGIGLLRESVESLHAAIRYLER